MSFSPSDSKLFGSLFADPVLTELFADERFVGYLLQVEGALALIQARLGLIPAAASKQIVESTKTLPIDWPRLQNATEQSGFPIIELINQLRKAAGNEAANYVHWGATTQDIMDTALILQLRDALALLESKLELVVRNLAKLADQHRHTLMAGRTHSQQALPITFGLKAAGWLAPLLRHRERLHQLKARLLVVEFGGAAGTLAALGDQGLAVMEGVAAELQLSVPSMPWHTQRDNLAELAGWLSLLSGSLAKMAQDIILMTQSEVSELSESADRSRGGSSTMPQKSNPIVSELIVAAARANATLLSAMHHALIQEHERGTHGWQLEWLTLPQMMAHSATALNKALFLSEQLAVDVEQMSKNVEASHGLMLAEAVSFALADKMDRSEAKHLIAEAVQIAMREKRHLVDVARERVNVEIDWDDLRDEANYLGATQRLIDQVLARATMV
ncbi:MAG: 3-carboxy-cis,cis-muconate cycloisomerase [Caldilineaceae bacterium]